MKPFHRYAIRYQTVNKDDTWYYVSIGTGATREPAMAHLYTSEALADTKAEYFRRNSNWYCNVELVPYLVYPYRELKS